MTAQPGTFDEGVPPRWGYQTSFWQRRQPAFWLFVIDARHHGPRLPGPAAGDDPVAPEAWFVTVFLLLPYAIPVIAIIYFLDLYEREPISILGRRRSCGAASRRRPSRSTPTRRSRS